MNPETDFTSLTFHPDWSKFVAYVNSLEKSLVNSLRSTMDPVSNRQLMFLTQLKADLRNRVQNKDLWNV